MIIRCTRARQKLCLEVAVEAGEGLQAYEVEQHDRGGGVVRAVVKWRDLGISVLLHVDWA